ncbi:SHOCT domain-containing protein [Mycolicibacterium arenosum]|uniref:SHOCT domain-containing protein n=1 Tax=Mycolicibacterium arenosum TaxID=2952157 RepID=A0ABT1M793_9MYCO|nr:SHOCT domain-containing protein [Mycolicibacterium sp. CAU 1645]MCP9274094.1 SHOCT domain-containing protein [Mycolicibacterium sp. CAU 1645]
MAALPIKHNLGFGNGKILEFPDGTAAYVKSMEFTQAFRVHISDVTGFSVTKEGKMLERRLHILGNGSTLAFVDVAHGTSELIENWFRAHKLFHGNVVRSAPTPTGPPATASPGSPLIADELRKLAELRNEGILSDAEFQSQKAKLLAR